MTKADWVWMPHAGHYICAEWCRFHLCTYVNGYIVSTIGDYLPDRDTRRMMKNMDTELLKLRGDEFDNYYINKYGYDEISSGSLFETKVFPAEKRLPDEKQCCPYKIFADDGELDSMGYNCVEVATKGHYRYCLKYDEMVFPIPKISRFEDIYDKARNGNDLINLIDLKKTITQFNYNVDSIKSWMSAQNTHNSLFMDRISQLEHEIKKKGI